jgi:CRISPR-associated protein Cmr5
MMKTLEQQFASRIYHQVTEYGDHHPKESPNRKKYGAMAHKLPILVHNAGLTQALAFVASRKEDAHQELLKHLAETIIENDLDTLLAQSRESKMSDYVFLTRKALLALKWYKRFAQSVLEIEPTDTDEGN